MRSKIPLAFVLSSALILGACFGELDDDDDPQTADVEEPGAQNQAPTISGSPPPNILEGEAYSFTPVASDPDGDTLEFSVARKPSWASFDRSTGRLWGTPDSEDVGNFTNIGISVTDGDRSAALPNFDISVNQIALGSATLSWMPPTQNDDGSPLIDLAGYRIYYGRDQNNLTRIAVLNNPGLTRYVVENLSPVRWYFTMTSVNAQGDESGRSATVSKTIT